MNKVVALAIKDLRLLVRDKAGFFFVFIFPLIYCIFFGAIFSGSGGGTNAIKVTVVDEDRTEESRAFVDALQETPELSIDLADRAQAAQRVRVGDRTGYVAVTKGFGEARKRMFWGDPARLEIGIDPSRRAEAGMLQGLLTKCAFAGMQEMFSNPDVMRTRLASWLGDLRADTEMDPAWKSTLLVFLPALDGFMQNIPQRGGGDAGGRGWQPVVMDSVDVAREWKGPRNSYAVSFPQGIIWGVMGCAAGFGISLVTERSKGTLVRLRAAPIGLSHILLGKAGACMATTLAVQTALLLVGTLLFKIRPDSYSLLVVAIVSNSVCFVGIMMLLSVLGKTEQSAGGIGWAILTVMAMIGGGMIPLFFMPDWLARLSDVSPIKWAIYSMEGALWRGFSVGEMLKPCAILIGVGVLCFAIGTRAFQWTHEG